jgi:pimeloyl-ACP methyl ester carboxylesterase
VSVADDAGAGTDEFGFLGDNAREVGFAPDAVGPVRRVAVDSEAGSVSALVWGEGPPAVVFLHGGAQNAHTWDSTIISLGHDAVAFDLPGHGHSDWRADHDYLPDANARSLLGPLRSLAPSAGTLVGMSLGGLTALRMVSSTPGLVERLVLVDITPGVTRQKAKAITDFTSGPESFASVDEVLERTIAHHPGRSVASLTRGVVHNTRTRSDGRVVWRWDSIRSHDAGHDFSPLWADVEALAVPTLLVRGLASAVVDDDDVARMRTSCADLTVIDVADAGHSVQGDAPAVLAGAIRDFARF